MHNFGDYVHTYRQLLIHLCAGKQTDVRKHHRFIVSNINRPSHSTVAELAIIEYLTGRPS